MKTLNEFVLEKLKVSKIETKYHPTSKDELVDLIIKEIETNGPNCSLNHIDVSDITDMRDLFKGGKHWLIGDHPVLSKFNGDISKWDVSNVTDMSYMFDRCEYSGKNGDISNWDVSNVTNMSSMFLDSKFNGDISKWDVSNVENMSSMFLDSKFNGDISKWNVSNVENMFWMFNGSVFNGNISKWKINPIIKGHMIDMFKNSPLENNPPKWYYKYR